jgi:hypothetical protein
MLIVRTDFKRARAKMTAMRTNVQRTLPECLESEARIAAVSLAKSTQPYGTGADALRAGEKAVERDISKVYVDVGKVWAAIDATGSNRAGQFWKLMKEGKYDVAQAILRDNRLPFHGIRMGPFDGGALHIESRNSRTGRVNIGEPRLLVTDIQKLTKYRNMKVGLVGFGKSAWAGIARQLAPGGGGTRGLRAPKLAGGANDITANWITRKEGPGHITRSYGNPNRPIITLTSTVRYADHILTLPARREAVRIAYERLIKQVQIAARYEARQACGLAA